MVIGDLISEVSSHVADPGSQLVGRPVVRGFINSAARDAAQAGWLIAFDESESITLAAATFEYNVPASFLYVSELFVETATPDLFDASSIVEPHQWQLGLELGVPLIRFDDSFFTPTAGRHLKVVGERTPTATYALDTDVVDAGMESFLRERASAYTARSLARGGDSFARQYEQLFQDAFAVSDKMIEQQLNIQQQRLSKYQLIRRVFGR